jgi:hypothetical protein
MAKRTTIQFPIRMTKKKYKALFHKAQKECNTASPVHDVLDLLFIYYIKNTFVVHRKMRMTDSPRKEEAKKDQKIWMRLDKDENKVFTKKVVTEGISKTYLMNLLIDFYLQNEFEIETKIIRINRL